MPTTLLPCFLRRSIRPHLPPQVKILWLTPRAHVRSFARPSSVCAEHIHANKGLLAWISARGGEVEEQARCTQIWSHPRPPDIRNGVHFRDACHPGSSADCMSGNEGSCYTKTATTSPQAGSVTQPVSAPMSRSRVLSGHAEMLASPM